jgi:hypothetical protein
VADAGHGLVMGRRAHPDRSGSDAPGQALDARHGGLVVGRDDDPRSVHEQIRARGGVAGAIGAGHRVAAHVAQPEDGRPERQRDLRARDVGHDRIGMEGGPQVPGEVVEQLEAGGHGSGQDDERGPRDRRPRIGRGVVDDAVARGGRGSIPARGPGTDRRPIRGQAAGATGRVAAERSGDRAADQPEPEQCHLHVAEYRRRRDPGAVPGCTIADGAAAAEGDPGIMPSG